jgi:surfeit locus 1 family protein
MKAKLTLKDKIFAVAIVVMIFMCLKLGGWQVQRMHWKNELISKLEQSKTTPPAPLNLKDYDDKRDLFKRITAKGEFLNRQEIYLGGKYLSESRDKHQIGVHIITPFKLTSGEVILVNRGWVPQDKRSFMERPESGINGEVELEGIIRESNGTPPWYMPANMPGKNVWFWLDVNAIIKYLDRQGISNVQHVLIQQTNLTVQSGDLPKPLNTELKFYNEHLTYVYTWFGLAIVLVIMLIIWYRRASKEAQEKGNKA